MHLENLDDSVSIKQRTRDYWREVLAALIKTWPGGSETEIRKIKPADCKKWATGYAKLVSPTSGRAATILPVAISLLVGRSDAGAT